MNDLVSCYEEKEAKYASGILPSQRVVKVWSIDGEKHLLTDQGLHYKYIGFATLDGIYPLDSKWELVNG